MLTSILVYMELRTRRPPIRRGILVVPQIYDDLRRRILSASLEPGASLSESRIAEDYGVSRTPVREAFKKLAEDGFLEVVPQVGSFVARIDLRAVRDSHFIRETLECRIVELAAAACGRDERVLLEKNLERQADAVRAGDVQGFFEADEALHRLLAQVAGHANAWHVIHAAKAQLDRVRQMSLAEPGRLGKRLAEHRAIVQHVVRGDGAGAAKAMHAHVGTIFEAIRNIAEGNAQYFVGLEERPAKGAK